ncbi:hypothetical protein NQ317_016251 [Molorchus minor]|uniref:Transposase n=1 Tax=Molorchus minor TaxID=1323400 RepID=A0ABQ9K0N5_9CUCU|nr:hypothetical protein NQ317_016251 [Molorchus minor]
MAKARDVTILRLPPYHCELNPIELIWAQKKRIDATYYNDSVSVINVVKYVQYKDKNFGMLLRRDAPTKRPGSVLALFTTLQRIYVVATRLNKKCHEE